MTPLLCRLWAVRTHSVGAIPVHRHGVDVAGVGALLHGDRRLRPLVEVEKLRHPDDAGPDFFAVDFDVLAAGHGGDAAVVRQLWISATSVVAFVLFRRQVGGRDFFFLQSDLVDAIRHRAERRPVILPPRRQRVLVPVLAPFVESVDRALRHDLDAETGVLIVGILIGSPHPLQVGEIDVKLIEDGVAEIVLTVLFGVFAAHLRPRGLRLRRCFWDAVRLRLALRSLALWLDPLGRPVREDDLRQRQWGGGGGGGGGGGSASTTSGTGFSPKKRRNQTTISNHQRRTVLM